MIESILSSFIMAITMLIGAYYLLKRYVEQQKNEALNMISDWLNSEEGQKIIYSIGVLIGNGAKSGVGITSKGGKLKLQDLLMQGIGAFIQNKIPMMQSTETPQEQPEQVVDTKFKSKY